jgi:Na+-driven multidrug efflux pump
MPVLAVAMTAMAVLRAHGDARRAMTAPLLGGVVNAVLDPLLVFGLGLGLGLDGAAIATVIARFAILAAAFRPALTVHGGFMRPSLTRLRADLRPAAIAVPAVLANIATPVGNALVTREVARFGTEAVAGFAVVGRLTPLAFAVIFALSGAIGPIIGQNFGAGCLDRVRAAFNAAVLFNALYVALATVALVLLREPILQLFEARGETRRIILLFCGSLALASFFNGVIFVANASFNNLGHPSYSTAINWGRHTLGTWPFAVAGAAFWGAAGALVGQALGGVIFAALASWLAFRVMGRRPAEGPMPFAHHARWQSLFARHK